MSSPDARTAPSGLVLNLKRGIFEPPPRAADSSRLQKQHPILYYRTWEDDLLVNDLLLDPSDLPSLRMNRSSHFCRRKLACDALATPLALGTVQRPGRGFHVHRRPRQPRTRATGADDEVASLFVLSIEKSGTSSLASLFNGRELQAHTHNWQTPSVLLHPACRHTNALDVLADVTRLAEHRKPAGACGLANTFSVQPRANRTYRVAVVRSPLDRFISAHNEHGTLQACVPYRVHSTLMALPWLSVDELAHGRCPSVIDEYVGKAKYFASAKLTLHLTPPHTTIHFRTQSYFLSSTDAQGVPMSWDRIGRLETLEADLGPAVEVLLRRGRRGGGSGGVSGGGSGGGASKAFADGDHANTARAPMSASKMRPPYFAEKNVRGRSERGRTLKQELQRHAGFMCNLCRVYGQDYVCLGYAFPEICMQQPCYDSLPARLRRALKLL